MEVHKVPGTAGSKVPAHGPYWLWPVRSDRRPATREPVGEVKIDFNYFGILYEPRAVALVTQDDDARKYLASFPGGDLLVACEADDRAFLFMQVSKPRKKSGKAYEIIVTDYEALQPVPPSFTWTPPPPKPEPPKPTDAERRKAIVEGMLDRNGDSLRRAMRPASAQHRRVKKSRQTKPQGSEECR